MRDGSEAGDGQRAIGILGGTFDPVHLGHLALAEEARRDVDLAYVLFVPNADPPHKQDVPLTPAHHREAMVRLAIEGHDSLILSRLELDRPGVSYAVDTVAEVAEQSRREERREPWFILSAEALDDFDTWHQPLRILSLCRFAVAPRPGAEALGAEWVTRHYPGFEERFRFLPGPQLDISSTQIRELIAGRGTVAGLVPPAVAHYIEEHGLYREVVAPGAGDRAQAADQEAGEDVEMREDAVTREDVATGGDVEAGGTLARG